MKSKIVSIIIVLFSINIVVSAQTKFGAKMGLNLSTLSQIKSAREGVEFVVKPEMIAGFSLGGYANYRLTNLVAMQGELIFSTQGATILENTNTGSGTIRLNYINLPVLLDIKPISAVPVNLLAGSQVGWCVGKLSNGKSMDDGQASFYRVFDFSVALGIQYTFIEHLICGVRYNLGVLPVTDVRFDNEYYSKGARNNVLQVIVGWTF
jgi:hypothetical protein